MKNFRTNIWKKSHALQSHRIYESSSYIRRRHNSVWSTEKKTTFALIQFHTWPFSYPNHNSTLI